MTTPAQLLEMSHNVSCQSPDAPQNPIQAPKKSSTTTTTTKTSKNNTPDVSSFKLPKPPAPPPPSAALLNKKMKYEREDEQNEQRVKLYNKIIDYLEDDIIGPLLKDISRPEPTTKLSELQIIEEALYKKLNRGRKTAMVENAFSGGLCAMEGVFVNFFQKPHMVGCSKRIIERAGPDLQKDLRMIALELDDDWVPGPKLNLLMSVFREIQTEFSNDSGPIPPPSST